MTIAQKSVLAGLIVAVVGLSVYTFRFATKGATCPPEPGQKPDRVFMIHLYSDGNDCFADLSYVTVWRTPQKQKVTWVSDDDNEYKVNFKPGTPFKDNHQQDQFEFDVKAHGQAASGVPVRSGRYYYSVTRNNEQKPCLDPSDPGVHVTP